MTAVRARHQRLPSAGPEREALRQKGQFWTPDWVAEAMVAYVIARGCHSIYDPAVGAGAFFRAAKLLAHASGMDVALAGAEIDPEALHAARWNGLSEGDLSRVEIRDFALDPPPGPLAAIVANPPYIRHHRLPARTKAILRELGARHIGTPLDGRAGLHVYFLIRALDLLDGGGCLAFIMPADTCEGVSAPKLWNWVARTHRLEAVVTFAPEASPFPGVDTNPLIFLIRKDTPEDDFWWVRCLQAATDQLTSWVASGFAEQPGGAIELHRRRLEEALATGLSRPPAESEAPAATLGCFATVMRGIVTGANEFFFLTRQRAAGLKIPAEFLLPAVGRTRDVPGSEVDGATIGALQAAGRPTVLFSPDGRSLAEFPEPVRDYLAMGERLGLPNKPLIATRRPWYKMETRPVPPFLFAYLGRRNARFIRNHAGVMPLTCFLCVYPRRDEPAFVDKLWRILQHPDTVANLARVGKSYGDGAIKVEPRALERLPLPPNVLAEVGLSAAAGPAQLQLPLLA